MTQRAHISAGGSAAALLARFVALARRAAYTLALATTTNTAGAVSTAMSHRPRQLNSEAGSSSNASSKPKTIAEFRAALQDLNAQLPPKSARLAEHERLYDEAVASSAEARRFLDAQPSADEQRRAAALAATKRAEAAAARRAEEEAARRVADEARKKQAAEEAQTRRAAEEEEARQRRAVEEEAARMRRAEEEAAARKRRASEEEAARKRRAEEEASEKRRASKRPASEAAASSSSAPVADDDDDDDDCVFVSEDFSKSSSMPHARYDCRQFLLKPGEERQHCDKCWCGVCGVPVRDCKEWAEHCTFTRAAADAKAAEAKRDAVKARVAAPRPPRQQLGPEQAALLADPRWNAMRFTVISYIDKCSHDEDAVLAAVTAVHDEVSHEVATRVLRTLQAVGDVMDIDGALHLRADTSLAPPPPPPQLPPQAMDLAAAIAALHAQRPPPPHHLHAPRPSPPHPMHTPRPPPPYLPHATASYAMAMGIPPPPQVPSRPPGPHFSSYFRPPQLGPAPGFNGPRHGHLGFGYYR